MPQFKRTTGKAYKPETIKLAFSSWFYGPESADGEQRAFCPICEDPETSSSPSASFNAADGVWNCLKNDHGGSIYELSQELKKVKGWDIRSAAMKAKRNDPEFLKKLESGLQNAGKRSQDLPDDAQIADWSRRLLKTKDVLADFQDARGISTATIREMDIGWNGSRYTIPVRDEDGEIINVRMYKLHASSANDKMLNIPGHGTAAIYGVDEIAPAEKVLITEGETDRILVRQILNNAATGIAVVSATAGAKTFKPEWVKLFKDKIVYVGYDNDDAGRQGAAKVAKMLDPVAREVYRVDVPVEKPGADWTDFFHVEGHTVEDFADLISSATRNIRSSIGPVENEGKKVTLPETLSEFNQGEVLEIQASVAGRQIEPYAALKTGRLSCSIDRGAACLMCPLSATDGEAQVSIQANDPVLFDFIDASKEKRNKIVQKLANARCSFFEVLDETHYNIEEIVVQPSVDARSDGEDQRPMKRTVFSVGTHLSDPNTKVRIVGKNVVDPRNSKVKFMAWRNQRVELDIDNFILTDDEIESLRIFQPTEGQRPLDKCKEVAHDLAQHVTHIYGRDLLHVAYDLVFHSVLRFRVHDMEVEKGWLEMMVVGDTRTGKSEIANRMIKHYKSGVLTSLEGASFAGIVGGVQQIDNRWSLTWGVVPMHDRRLVVLDEASGMQEGLIEQMSSVRSSGIAQISKIANESTSARTRLIWITNPKGGGMLRDSPDQGMSALRSVVPNLEDIARFDFATAAAKDEVPDRLINTTFAEFHTPTYGSLECETLVKWSWSLGARDVVITQAAANTAIRAASKMGKRYVADPPLIQGENVRYKILRIACAIAARTFSISQRGKLLVSKIHVEDAVTFLDEIYGQESMGYLRKSRGVIRSRFIAEQNKEEIKKWLLEENPAALDTLKAVGGSTFRHRDFTEFGALDTDAARQAVNKLIRMRMARRKTRGDIVMEPALVDILRDLEDQEIDDDSDFQY